MTSVEVVVFIAYQHTNYTHRRVLWRVSRDDAVKICSDPRTSFATSMLCFTEHDIDDPDLNRYVPDTGSCDDVLREHDITILRSHNNP